MYRATRDGFTGQAFHSKCDGKGNTITIIKNNFNFVFGCYGSSAWNSSATDAINDPNAFLFSLRRGGVSHEIKFTVKNAVHTLRGNASFGPTFGVGADIYICNQSNTKIVILVIHIINQKETHMVEMRKLFWLEIIINGQNLKSKSIKLFK